MRMNDRGYSLLELLIVLVIVGVLAAAAVPGMGKWIAKRELDGAARSMLSQFQQARSEAIQRNQSVSITIDTGNDTYSFSPAFMPTQSVPDHLSLTETFTGTPGFNSRGAALDQGSVAIVSSRLPTTGTPPHNTRTITISLGGSVSITP